ncbi:hypothetical protein B0I37DRAFT_428150 [Chaetomium sp. MPI-CAGE-AT-0009]|nr:hypothetical protein B0I37DRAFT_428150 [Chaetomium sp. MPI-CAGE-AT-0009]
MHYATLLVAFAALSSAQEYTTTTTVYPLPTATSAIHSLTSALGSVLASIDSAASSRLASVTSEAGSVAASLSSALATATAGDIRSSLESRLSSATSSASAAYSSVVSSADYGYGETTTATTATGNVAPRQTVGVVGALVGGAVVLANW